MRRAEKEITNRREIDSIPLKATVCRIELIDQDIPYIVPLSFWYRENCLYFYLASDWKKNKIAKKYDCLF